MDLEININMDNAAFKHPSNLVEILAKVARRVNSGELLGKVMDRNGNSVGSFEVHKEGKLIWFTCIEWDAGKSPFYLSLHETNSGAMQAIFEQAQEYFETVRPADNEPMGMVDDRHALLDWFGEQFRWTVEAILLQE